MKCLIVGGGIGGLCLAVGLRDTGVEVDLVEAKEVWTVYGVGIIQQSNVVRAMNHLGLLQGYLDVSYTFDDVGFYDAAGTPRGRITTPRLAGPEYPASLGVSRLALHKMLVEAAQSRQANIRVGTRVTSLVEEDGIVSVYFADGSNGRYDLVIGADGCHSQLRTYVLGEELKPTPTGQGVWRHNFARPSSIDHLAVFYGPQGNAGLVPLGPDLMYMFVTTTEPAGTRFEDELLAEVMRQRLQGFGGLISELKEQILAPADVVYRPLETVFAPRWHRGHVVLIGDAAHTATPHLGQGAGMAIEDALVLRDELAVGGSLDEALDRFVARRMDRCRFVTDLSAQVGFWEMENTHQQERMDAPRPCSGSPLNHSDGISEARN